MMKLKLILITSLCSVLLFGCSSKNSVNKQDTIQSKPAQETQINNTSISSNSSTNNIITSTKTKGTRVQTTIKDNTGKEFTIKLIPVKEKNFTQEDSWAGANAGDKIFTGDYRLSLFKNGNSKPTQSIDLKDITLDANQTNFHLLSSYTNVFLLTQFEGTDINIGNLFAVKDGKLIELKDTKENSFDFPYTGQGIKEIQPKLFQTALYDNNQGNWSFRMFKLDDNTFSLTPTNSETYNLEDGNKYYNTYFKQ